MGASEPEVGVQDQPLGTPALAPMGVGTWSWGNRLLWDYRPERDDPLLLRTFQECIKAGLTFFDTADSYGTGNLQGRSEILLGQGLARLPARQRQRVTVATKLAPYPWRLGRHGFCKAAAASCQRLGRPIDLVQLHWSTARYAPWQEKPLLQGLMDQVQTGGAKAVGLSNMGPRGLRRAAGWMADAGVPLRSVQAQFSLLSQQPLQPGGVLEVCRELGVTVVAYSPLALGLLTGRYTVSHMPSGLRGLLFGRLLPLLEPLLALMGEIGADHGSTPAGVAVNWCRAHGAIPIPGLRHPHHVNDMEQALGWMLSCHERQALDRASRELATLMPQNPFQSA